MNSTVIQKRKGLAFELNRLYECALRHFGHQGWWPGDTDLEICIGAILTQNTNWTNVEKAINNLKRRGLLSLDALFDISENLLAQSVRSAGYYNVKAKRIKNFIRVVHEEFNGKLENLFDLPTVLARRVLLNIKGIGPETADSILLYAGGHPAFVVDAYTRRIFSRHQWIDGNEDYEEIKNICEQCLRKSTVNETVEYWKDYHAQLVAVGKNYCLKKNPECQSCPLMLFFSKNKP
jgi:endonuclease-3 related protein